MEIDTKVIAYGLVASTLTILGFTIYNIFFVLNVIAMTIALYGANSIVAEGELKQLWKVLIVSQFALIFSNLLFSIFQQFIAFVISSFSLLVLIKYFLIRNHDSGWFGALSIELLSFLFLFIIVQVLAIMQLAFFSDALFLP